MVRIFPLIASFVLLALSGVGHRWLTGGFGTSSDLVEAAARLENVPLVLGDWEGQRKSMDARALEIAGPENYFNGSYRNRKTGEQVSVTVLCGRRAQLVVHQPEVCYGGAGYHEAYDKERYTIESSGAGVVDAFWTTPFVRSAATPDPLRIFWGWSDGGPWTAPASPRWSYLRSTYLYKLYVVRSMTKQDEPLESDPAVGFLRQFVPELRRCLSPR